MKLPPLRAVQYFETTARLNSFSRAAEVLNVTQSAVSHQIRLLEDFLGESLFDRQGRNLQLTPVGLRYYDEISDPLQAIARASHQIRVGESGRLRLAVFSSLAVKWLMPQLSDFRARHPEIDLSLEMYADHPDLSDKMADCFITDFEPGRNYQYDLLYNEYLYPVCSQKIWQQIKDKPLPDALWDYPLLSVTSLMDNDWAQWCKLGGFALPKQVKIHTFSHMLLATEAARYAHGITLLNHYFMNEIDREQLVRIPMHEMPTGDSLFFVYKKHRARQPEIVKLGQWLQQIAAANVP
ncbi:LysR substrate-binding domain-containing protein [Enterovibrio paralichthyis]|uniref:LysR substrate-binding domain-containing protein n=1 Tax=Enterovibrio paralichthyis TaxID=2853805 RepID=UPI001C4796FA|nr:LysR substrate-binding domain-containing protein [Enterovibrio paralichthyis]MBV7297158.1 LysR family transcriptional regulator [Enterovibrio paralichthyis]